MFDISALGTILGVWAHPDDEAYMMAGILAAAVRSGQKVACITATRGEQGSFDTRRWPLDQLAKVRTRELANCLNVLGVTDHTWLDYHDGKLSQADSHHGVAQIACQIERVKPDSVFTFAADGLTGHPDHQTISAWTTEAVCRSAQLPKLYYAALTAESYDAMKEADRQFNIFFNIKQPHICSEADLSLSFQLPSDLMKLKARALCCHVSQVEGIVSQFGQDWFESSWSRECFCQARIP